MYAADIVATLKMAGDASTLPIHGATARRGGRRRGWVAARASWRAPTAACAWERWRWGRSWRSACSLVLIAANRPSILAPTTHSGYYPRWMAGPLGGLLQGFTNNGETLKWLFTGSMVVMYGAYALAVRTRGGCPRAG